MDDLGAGWDRRNWSATISSTLPTTTSDPGAQFDPQFRNLVKSEIANFTGEDRLETAQAATPGSPAQPAQPTRLQAEAQPARQERIWRPSPAAKLRKARYWTCRSRPSPTVSHRRCRRNPSRQARRQARRQTRRQMRHQKRRQSRRLSSTACRMRWIRETLSVTPQLTPAAMMDYAKRTYGAVQVADSKED